jgi:hypothetical protein
MAKNDLKAVSVGKAPGAKTPERPSLLHRILAELVLRLFLFANLLLPYLRFFCSIVYTYERRHRILERTITLSTSAVDGAMKLGDSMDGAEEGKVAQMLGDVAVYWVRGVAGGIHQGLEDGLASLAKQTARKQ